MGASTVFPLRTGADRYDAQYVPAPLSGPGSWLVIDLPWLEQLQRTAPAPVSTGTAAVAEIEHEPGMTAQRAILEYHRRRGEALREKHQ